MACCGEVPTLEILAAVELLRRHTPELKVRVVNMVDLMKLQPPSEHPHWLSDRHFDALFTVEKPIIFAFHGYPCSSTGSPTGSPTGAPDTTTSMCVAIRKRARPLRPSTCA